VYLFFIFSRGSFGGGNRIFPYIENNGTPYDWIKVMKKAIKRV